MGRLIIRGALYCGKLLSLACFPDRLAVVWSLGMFGIRR